MPVVRGILVAFEGWDVSEEGSASNPRWILISKERIFKVGQFLCDSAAETGHSFRNALRAG